MFEIGTTLFLQLVFATYKISKDRAVGRSEILGREHEIVSIQGLKFWGAQQCCFSTKLPKSGGACAPPPAPLVPTALNYRNTPGSLDQNYGFCFL